MVLSLTFSWIDTCEQMGQKLCLKNQNEYKKTSFMIEFTCVHSSPLTAQCSVNEHIRFTNFSHEQPWLFGNIFVLPSQ